MKKEKKQTKKLAKKQEELNHHFIFIEAPAAIVAPQVLLWGEAEWWPQECPVRFIRQTEGELREGTQYQQKLLKPFGWSWTVEITKWIPSRIVERTFKTGMFKGYERVKIEEVSNGTRIDYELHYTIRGLLNKILWPVLFRKQHDLNLKLILAALKDYSLEKFEEEKRKE